MISPNDLSPRARRGLIVGMVAAVLGGMLSARLGVGLVIALLIAQAGALLGAALAGETWRERLREAVPAVLGASALVIATRAYLGWPGRERIYNVELVIPMLLAGAPYLLLRRSTHGLEDRAPALVAALLVGCCAAALLLASALPVAA